MSNQLLALYSIFFSSRNANAIQEQQLDVVENFWYNTKQKLPLPWKVFIDRSQDALQRQMADAAANENAKLSSWTMFSTLWREFRDSGAFHWCLQALYPFFARTTEHIIDGITARYALLELLGGYVSAMMLPKLRDLPYFQNLANRMDGSSAEDGQQHALPILPRLFSLAARLSFSAVLFGVLPSAIPSIAFVIPMPQAISNSPLRLDIPSVALRLLQTYVAVQQGIFSFVRIYRIQAPIKPEQISYPQLPIDLSTPEARRQIQLLLPVYISDRTLEGLINWGPIVWRELSRIYRIRLHFWPVRRWQRLGMRGSAAIFSTEIATWIYFSRDQKLSA